MEAQPEPALTFANWPRYDGLDNLPDDVVFGAAKKKVQIVSTLLLGRRQQLEVSVARLTDFEHKLRTFNALNAAYEACKDPEAKKMMEPAVKKACMSLHAEADQVFACWRECVKV